MFVYRERSKNFSPPKHDDDIRLIFDSVLKLNKIYRCLSFTFSYSDTILVYGKFVSRLNHSY